MRCSPEIVVATALVVAASLSAAAQTRMYLDIGRTPTDDEMRKWDIAVGPSGKELPPGSGNVPQGAFLYLSKGCVVCHGSGLEGTQYGPRLMGGRGSLNTSQPVRTVGSYWPFATALWDYINRAMPRSPYKEGSLTPDEVYSLTALILFKNEIIRADDIVDAAALPKIHMPNRDGFVPARPDWGSYGKGKRQKGRR